MTIFISYRREDSEGITGWIYDHLKREYGEEKVFLDTDNIPLGEDFRDVIAVELEGSTAVLAVIGPNWCGQDQAPPRILEDEDPVRIEIATALTKGIPVVPLFVRGAAMPVQEDLPEDLQPLCKINGMPVRPGRDFYNDIKKLTEWIDSRERKTQERKPKK